MVVGLVSTFNSCIHHRYLCIIYYYPYFPQVNRCCQGLSGSFKTGSILHSCPPLGYASLDDDGIQKISDYRVGLLLSRSSEESLLNVAFPPLPRLLQDRHQRDTTTCNHTILLLLLLLLRRLRNTHDLLMNATHLRGSRDVRHLSTPAQAYQPIHHGLSPEFPSGARPIL